mgnify:CR=1 FL=1
MHANYLDTLDWGITYCLLSDSYRHRHMGQSETQKKAVAFFLPSVP